MDAGIEKSYSSWLTVPPYDVVIFTRVSMDVTLAANPLPRISKLAFIAVCFECSESVKKERTIPEKTSTVIENMRMKPIVMDTASSVSYTHLRAHETKANLVC